ncbi:MAG: molybdopterin-dependent oxidoreductase [Dehalococcoidia bacterium]
MNDSNDTEQIVTTVCHDHCTSACVLKLHVKGGVITRVETDDGEYPQYRCCVRGRAFRQYVHHPDRLKYPLKRTGPRGEGKFERISWDEALETIASQLKRIKDSYGASSIILLPSGGDMGWLNNGGLIDRVLVRLGGYTGVLGTVSNEGTWFSCMATYGVPNVRASSSHDSLLDSRLIIMWGWNPVVTRMYMHTHRHLAQIKKAGIRVISVDPRYTETAALLANQWIPIKPGTDAAMMAAMAHVMITENLHDQSFLNKHTVGFDKYRDYVLGIEDGTPKTPAWAQAITGVPAATIVNLAREYATTKPAALVDGFAPARSAFGEQFNRAAATLAAMTGNIGIPGGSTCISPGVFPVSLGAFPASTMKGGDNPVHLAAPLRKNSVFYQRVSLGLQGVTGARFYVGGPTTAHLNRVQVADAILRGRSGGYPADYKMLYMVTINWLNQYANTNRIAEALKKLEFVVAQEQFMTPTAKFADIVLPTNTIAERNDVTIGFGFPLYGSMNKAIDSIGESKSQFEIAQGLAAKLGFSDFVEKTEEEWMREIIGKCPDIPDYETFKKEGFRKVKPSKSYVAFEEQIKDPSKNRFSTPSGKIEIFSQDIADMNNSKLPPIPKYVESWESLNDPLAKRYPLQLITTHYFRRTHSKFDNIPWLKELEPQAVTMHTSDASARGIKDGDMVRVFNDRGQMIIPAFVTERIMPGVVEIPEGAKFDPDENGVDRGGCPNVLTRDEPSPGGAFAGNTALVQVEKA